MLSFIKRIWHDITGDLKAIRNWILSLISAVYSFIRKEFDALAREVTSVWRDLERFAGEVDKYVTHLYNTLEGAITKVYDDITLWVVKIYGDLRNAIDGTIHTLNQWIADVGKAMDKLYNDTIGWVIKHVWEPLYHDMLGVLHWIANEGKVAFYYVTHPDALASLISHYIWSGWPTLLKRYSKPISRWLLHSMLGMAGEVADVIEIILKAVL